jgi:outer membrane protein, heavy metal efflux system
VKHFIPAIAFALLAAAATMAQETSVRATPPDPALDALAATALETTPDLVSARAAVEAAKRRVEPARTLADPSLSTSYQNDGRSPSLGTAEGSFVGLMLSQPLPWPGKLSLAGKAAESEAREIESGMLGRAALTIEARVRNAWYDLVLARALDRLIEERRETARQIEQTTRDRYAAGLAVQQDVLRAQVELARIDELKAAQRAVIAARLAELNRLLGRAQDAAIETAAALPATAPVPQRGDLIAAALRRSPEAAAAKQSIETGRLRVDMAKKNFLPDFVVSAGSMHRGHFEMGPMWQLGVGVSLPLWTSKRQQNQLAEAEARVVGQTAEADAIGRELEVRTRERIAQLEAANDVATLYRETIIALDELSLESALASYRASKVPFVTVFDAVNALYADRANYLGRLAEAAKWRVAIDEASLASTTSMR